MGRYTQVIGVALTQIQKDALVKKHNDLRAGCVPGPVILWALLSFGVAGVALISLGVAHWRAACGPGPHFLIYYPTLDKEGTHGELSPTPHPRCLEPDLDSS